MSLPRSLKRIVASGGRASMADFSFSICGVCFIGCCQWRGPVLFFLCPTHPTERRGYRQCGSDVSSKRVPSDLSFPCEVGYGSCHTDIWRGDGRASNNPP